eukprot:1352255-Amorphochlora_amoeboformis.AAC.2
MTKIHRLTPYIQITLTRPSHREDASRGIDWGSRKPKKASSKGNRTPRVHTPTSPGGRRQEGKPSRPSDVRDNLK